MSVRPEPLPSAACLATSEGTLILISIAVEARYLESLLEALAELEFPVNPQIYHDAAIVTRFADGDEETRPVTLVEFPSYAGRVEETARALVRCGFARDSIQVVQMLDDIQSDRHPEPVPAGAGFVERFRVRRAGAPRLA